MKVRCCMLLDDKTKRAGIGSSFVSRRLGRLREITLLSILGELLAGLFRSLRCRHWKSVLRGLSFR